MKKRRIDVSVSKVEDNGYEKWCKKEGLVTKEKINKIKYCALKDENAKNILKEVESGAVSVEDVEFYRSENKKDIKNLEKLIIAICVFAKIEQEKIESIKSLFKNANEIVAMGCVITTMNEFGEDLAKLVDCNLECLKIGKDLEETEC